MKLLHLAFLNGNPLNMQFFRKVDSQFRAMKRLNRDSWCFVIGENYSNLDFSEFGFNYIDLKEFVFSSESHRLEIQFGIAEVLIESIKPDIVYCRYPWADKHLYGLVRKFPVFVFEHQTKEIPELSFNKQFDILRRERAYGSKVIAHVKGIVAVTDDCRVYQQEKSGGIKPAYTMGNGIDPDRFPVSKRNGKVKCDSVIEILCLASFTVWHGYDRLIEGVRNYKGNQKFLVHMVGDGSELNSYRNMVKTYGLDDIFKFWGPLNSNSYAPIIERSHIAIGSLGLHRMNLDSASSLKNREYCARGIPFCFSGSDSDFDHTLPFVFTVPANDDPLDIGALLSFAEMVNGFTNLNGIMRAFTVNRLSWDVKIRGLLSFFRSLDGKFSELNEEPVKSVHYPLNSTAPNEIQIDRNKLFAGIESKTLKMRGTESHEIDVLLTRASVRQALKDNHTAISIYREILETFNIPEPFLFRCLVELEKLMGNDEVLIRHYGEKVLGLYAKKKRMSVVEEYRLGSLFKKFGNTDQAEFHFKRLLKKFTYVKNPSLSGGVYFHLAEIYLSRGDRLNAKRVLKKCLVHIPAHGKAIQYLENIN